MRGSSPSGERRAGGGGGLPGLSREARSAHPLVCLFPVDTQEKEEDPFNYGEHRRARGRVCWCVRWGAKEAAPFPEPARNKPLCLLPADYQSLRIGGLVFAVVLFTVGILLILSKLGRVGQGSGGHSRGGGLSGKAMDGSHSGHAHNVSLPLQAGGAGAVSTRSPGE